MSKDHVWLGSPSAFWRGLLGPVQPKGREALSAFSSSGEEQSAAEAFGLVHVWERRLGQYHDSCLIQNLDATDMNHMNKQLVQR